MRAAGRVDPGQNQPSQMFKLFPYGPLGSVASSKRSKDRLKKYSPSSVVALKAPVVVEEIVMPWPASIKVMAGVIVMLAMVITMAVTSRQTFLDWDSYMFLNGARTMLGWKGSWLNAYAHPICPYMYSWLLSITQHWKSFALELRAACGLNVLWTWGALGAGFWWLRETYKKEPWLWVLSSLVMVLNSILVEYAATPLTDFIAMFLGTIGVIFSMRAARENSLKWRLWAAAIFGLAVPFKYQMWSVALVGMAFEWFESSKFPVYERIKRFWPYAVIGFMVSVFIQIFLWTTHPPLHTSDPIRIFKEFLAYYKDAQIAPGSRQPPWEYIFIIRNHFGYPALAALILGLAAAWSAPPMIRANALWLTIYVVSLFIYGTKTKRYVPQFLVPLSALVAYGVVLIPGIGVVRAKVFRLAAAIAVVGMAGIFAAEKFVWMMGPGASDPTWISLGSWIRERKGIDNRLVILEGGSSWATFVTQMTPTIEFAKSQWVARPPTAWPMNILQYFRDGDLIIASPRKTDDEFITMQIHRQELNLKIQEPLRRVYGEISQRPISIVRRGDGWFFERDPEGTDVWYAMTTNGGVAVLPYRMRANVMNDGIVGQIAKIVRLSQDFKYHALRQK